MAFGRGLAETARLVAELELRDNLSRGIGTALGSVGRLESGLSRMGRGVGQVGAGLDRLGTRAALAAGGGLVAVLKTAADFEEAFTGIEKTVDETANTSFPELEDAIRKMARTSGVAFEQLAAIGESGGALGIGADSLEQFIDVVNRLAVSTDLSSDQAATALGQLGNVLHLRGGDFRDFADSLVALGNAGASTESQIVEIAARFGAAGNAAGLSKEEILALSSAVASMGIEVEAGGSALSRIFNSVATNIGTSSDKATAFAKTLGLSAREFRQAWEKDALGTFQDFLRELGKLDQFQQAKVLKAIGITNTRDVNTVRLMGQNVGFVTEQLRIADRAQGALNKESDKFFNTTNNLWRRVIQGVRDGATTIGNELLPEARKLTREFLAFLDKPDTQAKLKEFGQNLAKGIRDVVTEIRNADFSGLLDQLKGAADFAKTAFDAFNALPGPLKSAIIAGIAINKATGGGLGLITAGLRNILGGAGSVLGGLAGRGSSPTNPVFVSAVGGGLGGPGGGGKGGLLGFLFGGAAAGLAVQGGFSAIDDLNKNLEQGKLDFGAILDLSSPSGLIGRAISDLLGIGRKPLVVGGAAPATPTGQFVPGNRGGTPASGPGRLPDRVHDMTTDAIRAMNRQVRQALKDGDIHQARILQRQVDLLHDIRLTVPRRINDVIPHLGRVNRALAVANRNLDDGNARQREVARGIRESRDATQRGFSANNAQLGIIAAKDTSVDVNVTVPVTTTVSINDIIRQQTTARLAVGRGFLPGSINE